ncbi:DUF2568 domain-containing protein [Brevibacterium sp. ACRRH]|uniref:DUF2568 domain-containing protein n=1 Tax=Brevibacterium sp. ACRRH TaxID=2918183 RepID=UPI001EF5FB3A|nr:DUF2568 domain-containing protein [Brevibacterium sp. ACRRH]MCG7299425.1 DUF2568 domain-containing protein [Brevibacterium sp. ACRRH]
MTQFIKVVHTLHYFAEALSWGAITYSAFLIFGRGWLGILCGGLALIATTSVWSLFASSRAFFRSPIAVVASRVLLYALAVAGLVVAGLHIEAIILAVLLVLTEGILIGFKAHPALHPHSGGQARLVSDGNPKTAERRTPSNRGPRIVPGVQPTSGEQRTGQFMSRREARLAREAQAKDGGAHAGGKPESTAQAGEVKAGNGQNGNSTVGNGKAGNEHTGGSTSARIVGETPKRPRKKKR